MFLEKPVNREEIEIREKYLNYFKFGSFEDLLIFCSQIRVGLFHLSRRQNVEGLFEMANELEWLPTKHKNEKEEFLKSSPE